MKDLGVEKNITKGITFRLPASVLGKLVVHANNKQISLNTLVNQILRGFVEWDVNAVEAGWTVFPKPALKELIDNCDEEKLETIAKHKAEYHKDIRLLMLGQNDLEGFFTLLRNRCHRSGFPFSETKQNNNITHFVIQHDMGEKWSLFNKILYVQIINDLGYKMDVETTKSTIVLNIHHD